MLIYCKNKNLRTNNLIRRLILCLIFNLYLVRNDLGSIIGNIALCN
jgi:hypothetical protein